MQIVDHPKYYTQNWHFKGNGLHVVPANVQDLSEHSSWSQPDVGLSQACLGVQA
jgi:hypothetical protein